MSKLMEVMTVKHMLIFLFCVLIILCGCSQGLLGCDVEVQVRRGTVVSASPHQHVEVKCLVQHCGKSVKVIWCKLPDRSESKCKNLSNSDHIQINENMLSETKLESVLTFKRISAEDSGLYSCHEVHHRSVGHSINVTVSETNQGDQNLEKNPGIYEKNPGNYEKNPDQPKNDEKDQDGPNDNDNGKMKMLSFVYFVVFVSVLLLFLTITVVVVLRIYGCKPLPRHKPITQEEQPSHMIPGLPKRSSPVLHQSLSVVNNVSSSVFEPPPERTIGNQLVTSTSVAQRSPVYSHIDRTKSRKSFQHHASGEGTSEMNAISVISSELLET